MLVSEGNLFAQEPIATQEDSETFTDAPEEPSDKWIDEDMKETLPEADEVSPELPDEEVLETPTEEETDTIEIPEEAFPVDDSETIIEEELSDVAEEAVEDRNITASGTWGTVPWTWDDETATMTLRALENGEPGLAGGKNQAPWRTASSITGPAYERGIAMRVMDIQGEVILPADSSMLFRGTNNLGAANNVPLTNLTTVLGAENLNTSQVTNMQDMFSGTRSLTELDVSGWDVGNVTTMSSMFSNANSLTKLDVSRWDVSNVTTMSNMFSNARSLTELDVSGWDVGNVTTMLSMFQNASSLTELDVSDWDVGNVTTMSSMFNGARGLQELDISGWDMSRPPIRSSFLSNTTALSTLILGEMNHLVGSSLPNVPNTAPYLGRWLHIPETVEDEEILYTSEQLMDMTRAGSTIPGTYVWAENGASVTVSYLDQEGNEASRAETLTGMRETFYTAEPKTIASYDLVLIPENETGRFTAEVQEVIYVYEYLGQLALKSTPKLDFGEQTITNHSQTIWTEAKEDDLIVENFRRREDRMGWELRAKESKPFTNISSDNEEQLGYTLWFVNENQEEQPLAGSAVIARQTPEEAKEQESNLVTLSDGWGKENRFGIKSEFPVQAQKIGEYQATVTWELTAAPENP